MPSYTQLSLIGKTCLHCGSPIVVRFASMLTARKYCSRACAYASKERIVERPIDRGERSCPICGTTWTVTTRTADRIYCSTACRWEMRARLRKFEERVCIECGAAFTAHCKSSRVCCTKACGLSRRARITKERSSTPEARQRMSDWSTQMHAEKPPGEPMYSNRKSGRREDLDNRFFRSAWEANVARYLNFLLAQGQIHKWEYEADTFWFEAIKRGVRSYKPDFKIWDTADGEPYYWEVKGYDYPRGITARKRMAKYYPKVRLVVIDKDAYTALKKWKALIPGWE